MTDREFESLLVSTFTVYRPQKAPDEAGGFIVKLEPIGTIKGRLSIRNSNENEYTRANQFIATYKYTLFTLPDVDLKRGDILEAEGKEKLRVAHIKEPSFIKHHLEVSLEEIEDSEGI